METSVPPVKARFSLDDPNVTAKLVRHFEAVGVRIAFHELCQLFGCAAYEDRARLKDYLQRLDTLRTLVEIEAQLYCRPRGRAGTSLISINERRKARVTPRGKTSGTRDDAKTARETADFLAAARTRTGVITTRFFAETAERLGIASNRIAYVLQRLCKQRLLKRAERGSYLNVDPAAESSDEPLARAA